MLIKLNNQNDKIDQLQHQIKRDITLTPNMVRSKEDKM